MADAMCGPANPLQAFQKQASADRSLQQDRLGPRAGPSSQGFRSFQRNPGALDSDFDAFQAGHQTSLFQQPLEHNASRFAPIIPPPQQQQQQPTIGGWANEFSKLHISSPPAMRHQQTMRSMNGWEAEFQHQQQTPAHFQSANTTYNPASAQTFLQRSTNPMLGYGTPNLMDTASKGKEIASPSTQMDADAFDREFERVAQSEDPIANQQPLDPEMQQLLKKASITNLRARSAELQLAAANTVFDILKFENQMPFQTADLTVESTQGKLAEQLATQIKQVEEMHMDVLENLDDLRELGGQAEIPAAVDTTRLERLNGLFGTHDKQGLRNFFSYKGHEIEHIEHLLGPEQNMIQEDDPAVDHTAADRDLAIVAGQVADNLGNNTTDKFRNSEFLKFMRQLNGYEKVLRGDKVVDNDSARTPSSAIPPDQQDDDRGRGLRMAGALSGSNDGQRSSSDLRAQAPTFQPGTSSYGGHPVEDFTYF